MDLKERILRIVQLNGEVNLLVLAGVFHGDGAQEVANAIAELENEGLIVSEQRHILATFFSPAQPK